MSIRAPNAGFFVTLLGSVGGLVLNPILLVCIICQCFSCPKSVGNFSASFSNSLMNMMSICISLSLGLFLIARVLNGECDSLDEYHRWNCNPEFTVNGLPQSSVLLLMMLPLIYSVAIKSIPFPYVVLSWFIVVVCIIVAIAISNSFVAIPVVIVYVPLSLICIFEIHRQNVFQFLVLKQQQILFDQNKQLAEETHNELRFMIANMAHDLKTVRLAFECTTCIVICVRF